MGPGKRSGKKRPAPVIDLLTDGALGRHAMEVSERSRRLIRQLRKATNELTAKVERLEWLHDVSTPPPKRSSATSIRKSANRGRS